MRIFVATLAGLLVLPMPTSTPAAVGHTPKFVATKIVVTANGARSNSVSGDETTAFCAKFRLSSRDVKTFFASAQQVNARVYGHDLDMSRCHARGTVRFTNGWRGQWTIDLMRRGALRLANGRSLYFYCLDCASAKFDPLDDEEKEAGRELIRASRITG